MSQTTIVMLSLDMILACCASALVGGAFLRFIFKTRALSSDITAGCINVVLSGLLLVPLLRRIEVKDTFVDHAIVLLAALGSSFMLPIILGVLMGLTGILILVLDQCYELKERVQASRRQ